MRATGLCAAALASTPRAKRAHAFAATAPGAAPPWLGTLTHDSSPMSAPSSPNRCPYVRTCTSPCPPLVLPRVGGGCTRSPPFPRTPHGEAPSTGAGAGVGEGQQSHERRAKRRRLRGILRRVQQQGCPLTVPLRQPR